MSEDPQRLKIVISGATPEQEKAVAEAIGELASTVAIQMGGTVRVVSIREVEESSDKTPPVESLGAVFKALEQRVFALEARHGETERQLSEATRHLKDLAGRFTVLVQS